MRRAFGVGLALLLVLAAAPPAAASLTDTEERLVFALLIADENTDTLIAVVRVDPGFLDGIPGIEPGESVPIHMNFFDKDCLVRDREDELTPLDVDVYVYSGFATGIAKGAGEIHLAPPGEPHGSGPDILMGEAVIIDFARDVMYGYSAAPVDREGCQEEHFTNTVFSDYVRGIPHFLAEAPGILTNEVALAAVPLVDCSSSDFGIFKASTLTDIDTYPSGSSDLFSLKWLMFDGNEEEASATSTFKCVLHASLSSIFGPITTLGSLPPDEQEEPRILFYPYGWVRVAIESAPTGNIAGSSPVTQADNWGAEGIFRQTYTDGAFSWGEATNLFGIDDSLQNCIPGVDGGCPD